jgi:hypothetical protein
LKNQRKKDRRDGDEKEKWENIVPRFDQINMIICEYLINFGILEMWSKTFATGTN